MNETPDTTETPPDETGQEPVPSPETGDEESSGDVGSTESDPSAD
jgi:hypothetical protein